MELASIAFQQLASISAVLGGLAFTAAAALLAAGLGSSPPAGLGRAARITIGTAVLSAVCLVLAALMWSFMAADLARAGTRGGATTPVGIESLNWLPSLALLGGALLFFASIGASGWIASRNLGRLSSAAALVGSLALLWMIRLFGS
jgi:hypothetical protein